MSIKTFLTDIGTDDHKMEYPKIMKSKSAKELIVLFVTECEGTVIHVGDKSSYSVGFYYDSWKISSFKEYSGNVILKNVK